MKLFTKTLLLLLAFVAGGSAAKAAGWPANYQGVMLQGFYWDSYSDTRWSNLESQADELSKYFSLIWVPNSGYCGGGNNMGYMPQYWFTRHTSAFGSETQLRSMIATYKEKGVGIIEDVVVNHRNGISNWYDFPTETWDGQTWKIGLEGICANDEMAYAAGQPKPTGANDTGDNFDGCRDLDHTNANVQNNVKNYCRFLLTDLGYAGFRLDMVKGYGGQYTKIYNEYSKPTYCVGEYWDGQYDAVAAWIEATGRTSAAFDFPGKYAINEAFHSGDLTKLVWKANGTTDQPAGLIHFGYPQYAVTFIDNHDTYRDGSKFNGNVVAANAFILCSPGTPCVFLPHYKNNKAAIQRLIDVRNSVGLHNLSAVSVLRSSADCYMAEVTGANGKLVVKIGPAMASPSGYTDADIVASGTDYCVWTKVKITSGQGGGTIIDPDPVPVPGEKLTIYFDNSTSRWATPHIYYWPVESPAYPGVAMTRAEGDIWSYTCPAGTTGILFNAGDGDATKTADMTAVDKHLYSTAGDRGLYQGGHTDPDPEPASMWVLGNLEGAAGWGATPGTGAAMTRRGDRYTATVTFAAPAGATECYFNLTDYVGSTWDDLNAGANRYGAATEGEAIVPGTPASVTAYLNNVDASGCMSWTVAPGRYAVDFDRAGMTITLTKASSGIDTVEADTVAPVYYNLQGVRVEPSVPGLYIVVRGTKVSKEFLSE